MASYSDDFNRPDSTNIGNWTEIDDNWSIISQQLAPGVSSVALAIYQSPLDTANHYAQIAMPVVSPSSGVFARSDINGTNFYLLRGNASNWTLFVNIGGNFTGIGSYGVPAANGDIARIECQGSTIKGFINGVERISVTNTEIPTGAYAGIRSEASSTARYDNFLAADVGGGGPTTNTGAFFEIL